MPDISHTHTHTTVQKPPSCPGSSPSCHLPRLSPSPSHLPSSFSSSSLSVFRPHDPSFFQRSLSPPPVLLSPFPPFLSLTSFSNIQKRGWSLQEFSRMPGRLKGYRRLTKGTDTAGRESLFRQVMCADTQSIQGYIHWGQLTKNNKIFWFFSHSPSQYQ